jgi:hypothetical protein
VNQAELLVQLVELAEAAGLRVRAIRGTSGAEGEPAAASGLCRVRGELWIVLSNNDSLEDRVAVVAAALRREASEWLQSRYLPPALRDRIYSENDSD